MIAEVIVAAMLQVLPTARPADSLGWDYTDADLADGQVTEFAICMDGQALPCTRVKPADAKIVGSAGAYQWKLPPLTVGSHSVTVQACNNEGCSVPASLTFALVVVPKPVSNLHIGGTH